MSNEVVDRRGALRFLGRVASAGALTATGIGAFPEEAEASPILNHPFWGRVIQEDFVLIDARWVNEWDGNSRRDGIPTAELGRKRMLNLQLKEDEFEEAPRFPKIMLNGIKPLDKTEVAKILGGKKLAMFCKGNIRAPELLAYIKENMGIQIKEAIFLEGGMDQYLKENAPEQVGENRGEEVTRVAQRN